MSVRLRFRHPSPCLGSSHGAFVWNQVKPPHVCRTGMERSLGLGLMLRRGWGASTKELQQNILQRRTKCDSGSPHPLEKAALLVSSCKCDSAGGSEGADMLCLGEPRLPPPLPSQPWASYLAPLSLGVLVHKVGLALRRVTAGIQQVSPCETQSSEHLARGAAVSKHQPAAFSKTPLRPPAHAPVPCSVQSVDVRPALLCSKTEERRRR